MWTISKRLGYVLAAVWIFGGAAIYYWRFTALFLDDHGPAIAELRARIGDWFAGLM